MDPVSLVIAAVIGGFVAGLKPTAEQAIKDAYQGLKRIISDRYQISLDNLEKKHVSKAQQDSLQELLQEKAVQNDAEVMRLSNEIIEFVRRQPSDEFKIVQEMIGTSRSEQYSDPNANARQTIIGGGDNKQSAGKPPQS